MKNYLVIFFSKGEIFLKNVILGSIFHGFCLIAYKLCNRS